MTSNFRNNTPKLYRPIKTFSVDALSVRIYHQELEMAKDAALTYVNGDYLNLEYSDEINMTNDSRELIAKAVMEPAQLIKAQKMRLSVGSEHTANESKHTKSGNDTEDKK